MSGVFKSEFDHGVEVIHEILHALDCLVVPRKIREISSMNLFQKGIAQIKASRMVSS